VLSACTVPRIECKGRRALNCETDGSSRCEAYSAREFTSTALFGTSMSARRILGLEKVPRVGLFAH
jgi:hypothetical protein